MLLLGSRLHDTPVMGIQTGARLATIGRPLIDPANLRIVAYTVEGPMLAVRPSYLRTEEIRELSDIGMIVDSTDDFITTGDVIRIDDLLRLNFSLIGLRVIDEQKRRIGKIDDYTLDTDTFVIQQLNVRQTGLRSLTETGRLIHRSQIREINDTHIVVASPTVTTAAPVSGPSPRREFVNPFASTPAREQRDQSSS